MKNTIITSTDAWRLFRYLGKRIYRRTEMDGIARAVELGILGRDKISVRGTQLVRFSPGPLAVGRSQAELQRLIAQANLRTVQDHRSRRDVSSSFFAREHDDANVELKTVAWDEVTCELLALVRGAASSVRTVDVAVAALLAQALLRSSTSLAELLRVLAKIRPINLVVDGTAIDPEPDEEFLRREVEAAIPSALEQVYPYMRD